MDVEHPASNRNWIFNVILDKITARIPVTEKHKGLEAIQEGKIKDHDKVL